MGVSGWWGFRKCHWREGEEGIEMLGWMGPLWVPESHLGSWQNLCLEENCGPNAERGLNFLSVDGVKVGGKGNPIPTYATSLYKTGVLIRQWRSYSLDSAVKTPSA